MIVVRWTWVWVCRILQYFKSLEPQVNIFPEYLSLLSRRDCTHSEPSLAFQPVVTGFWEDVPHSPSCFAPALKSHAPPLHWLTLPNDVIRSDVATSGHYYKDTTVDWSVETLPCKSRMKVQWHNESPLILCVLDENDEIIAPGCTSVYLKALRQGYVIVTARYKYKDINIKATVTVAAYIPLKVKLLQLILSKSCTIIVERKWTVSLLMWGTLR